MEIETPKEFFEKVLPKRFNAEKTEGVNATVQMKITGPTGGNWIISIKDQKLEVEEGTHPSPEMSIEMSDSNYLDVVNGKISGERAFMTGKLKFKGNITTAMQLKNLGFL